MRVFCCLLGALALLLIPWPVLGQWPGEIRGDVTDVLSGRPVASAEVVVGVAASAVSTDAAGSFHLRGLEPGDHVLRVRAAGYALLTRTVRVENGAVTALRLELTPEVVALEGVVARVDARASGALTLDGRTLEAAPGATLGDLVGTLPGVRVGSRGRGGDEVPSIRGSGGDAVLVLVDGVPLNDPVTGEADLSTIPVAGVSAIHVLPGGRSARYGARAQGGVILVETARADSGGLAVSARAGSLGERGMDLSLERHLAPGTLSAGGGLRGLDGGFAFRIPEAAGGGRSWRENADVSGAHARAEWTGEAGATRFRLGGSTEDLDRGLPGRSYAPSLHGRQALRRGRLFGSVERTSSGGAGTAVSGYLLGQRMDHQDPHPPFGDPYDDRTSLRSAGGELRVALPLHPSLTLSAGASAADLRIRSTQLSDDGEAAARTDLGAWLSASAVHPAGLTLSAAGRLDRAGVPERWYASHDLGAAWGRGGASVRVAWRSSFSPPTLGDQFFRDGVGIEPNPDLEAERVPSEWAAGVAWSGRAGATVLSFDAEAYVGDIQGMIVWLPDFRFVWSPRNMDVRRRGVDIAARAGSPSAGLDARAHVSWNRTTYLRTGHEDVQVVYRPELTAGVSATWSHGPWDVTAVGDHTGARYPVPNDVNRLPGFWTTDLGLSRRWSTRHGAFRLSLEVERLFDHEDSLIFAFPDPGRTARLALRWSR